MRVIIPLIDAIITANVFNQTNVLGLALTTAGTTVFSMVIAVISVAIVVRATALPGN
jgi:hypothetical protein